jgi:hypothetical protein
MHRHHRQGVICLVLIGCAWVLWEAVGEMSWSLVKAYDTRIACETEADTRLSRLLKAHEITKQKQPEAR